MSLFRAVSALRPFSLQAMRCSLLLAGMVAAFPQAGAAAAPQARHHSHHRPISRSARPVLLSPQPGSVLDSEARRLNRDDLQDAAKHHDSPVVLVGSAPLSPRKEDIALFVQLQSARLCGSAGCTTSVYLRRNGQWQTALDSINGDISVLPTRHRGLNDLLIGTQDRWVWNGQQYQDTLSSP